MKLRFLAIFVLMILIAGCAVDNSGRLPQASQPSNPAWVDELIQKSSTDPVANPPLSVWKYEYNGQAVYFVPAHCCDIPSTLYDAQGTVICSPDGGLAGKGDGKCSDFFDTRTGEQLIWQDTRSQ